MKKKFSLYTINEREQKKLNQVVSVYALMAVAGQTAVNLPF
jgi:hypothetical protein